MNCPIRVTLDGTLIKIFIFGTSTAYIFRGITDGFNPDYGVQKASHSNKLQAYTSSRVKNVWDNFITHINTQV
jgi:hypothetical protein